MFTKIKKKKIESTTTGAKSASSTQVTISHKSRFFWNTSLMVYTCFGGLYRFDDIAFLLTDGIAQENKTESYPKEA
jgi:hypothetical protein